MGWGETIVGIAALVGAAVIGYAIWQHFGGTSVLPTGTGSIEGEVKDAYDNSLKIADATVTVDYLSARTGTDGKFRIDNVPVGTKTVTAIATGYLQNQQQITIRSQGEVGHVDFYMGWAVTPIGPPIGWPG